jgi:hypothetical protein
MAPVIRSMHRYGVAIDWLGCDPPELVPSCDVRAAPAGHDGSGGLIEEGNMSRCVSVLCGAVLALLAVLSGECGGATVVGFEVEPRSGSCISF